MAFSADELLSESLENRKKNNAFRQLTEASGLVDFCSNDYLGFACSDELKNNIEKEFNALQLTSNGSGGSRLLAGNTAYAEQLEKKIAQFHQAAAGLIFNSGYDANVGLFSSLGKTGSTIIYDELIHASVHDGIKMSAAAAFMFRHNDLLHLEERLKTATGKVYVAVESIYSMDGDEALLPEISSLCIRYNANLIVDEAHATGVTANGGKGLVQLHNLENDVFARVHTFGKGLGYHGAIVLGSELLRNYLINFARSFIYTTALPLHSLAAIDQSYCFLQENVNRIIFLQQLVQYFKTKANEGAALHLLESSSPIQCLIIPGNDNVKTMAVHLQQAGFDVRPIVSPTVKRGEERLRICLHFFNTEQQIDGLIKKIKVQLQTMKG